MKGGELTVPSMLLSADVPCLLPSAEVVLSCGACRVDVIPACSHTDLPACNGSQGLRKSGTELPRQQLLWKTPECFFFTHTSFLCCETRWSGA